jgi:hypothetical protein
MYLFDLPIEWPFSGSVTVVQSNLSSRVANVRECGARESDVPLRDSSTVNAAPIIHYPDLAIIEIRCPRHPRRRLYPKVDDDDAFTEGEGENSTTHALSDRDTSDTARASESRPHDATRHPSHTHHPSSWPYSFTATYPCPTILPI